MIISLIENRSLVKISGEDSLSFLQGLVTTDMNNLKDSVYSLMLTAQGKYLFDFFIIRVEDYFICDIENSLVDNFIKKIQFYKLRSKVTIEKLFPLEASDESENNIVVIASDSPIEGSFLSVKDPRSDKLGYRSYHMKTPTMTKEIGSYHLLRIQNMIPEACYDLIQEKSFPLEYGLEKFGAISFNKGCYVGQEVITRTHHRGVIRKTLCLIKNIENKTTDSKLCPEKSSPLLNEDGVEIGIMASSVNDLGLALIRNDFLVEVGESFLVLHDNLKFVFLRVAITLN
jgi:folate-binding protein YgfZ